MSRIAKPSWRGWAAGARRGGQRPTETEETGMDINGQAALISGGGSGLGRATAQALAQAGVRVAVLDLNEAAAVATAKEIGGLALACDVTNAGETEQAVAAARERHGPARLPLPPPRIRPPRPPPSPPHPLRPPRLPPPSPVPF